jgi:hypothetical protein
MISPLSRQQLEENVTKLYDECCTIVSLMQHPIICNTLLLVMIADESSTRGATCTCTRKQNKRHIKDQKGACIHSKLHPCQFSQSFQQLQDFHLTIQDVVESQMTRHVSLVPFQKEAPFQHLSQSNKKACF